MSKIPESLPLEFDYNTKTKVLDVEFGDGSIIRYFDIDPRSAFLSPTNERRNYDFINFLRANDGSRFRPEVLREATEHLSEPEQNAVAMNRQQNGEQRSRSRFVGL